VSTLIVLWMAFPGVLFRLKTVPSADTHVITRDIVYAFYLHLTISLVGLAGPGVLAVVVTHPLACMPVFYMGACAGELCSRERVVRNVWPRVTLMGWVPLPPPGSAIHAYIPSMCSRSGSGAGDSDGTAQAWGELNSRKAASLITVFVVQSLLRSIVWPAIGAGVQPHDEWPPMSLRGSAVLCAIAPFAQLTLIVGLARENEASAGGTERTCMHSTVCTFMHVHTLPTRPPLPHSPS
jgi:hypothetical protein